MIAASSVQLIIDQLRQAGVSDKDICDGALVGAYDLANAGYIPTADAAEVVARILVRMTKENP